MKRHVPVYAWIGVVLIFIGISSAITSVLAHVFDSRIPLRWTAIVVWLCFAVVGAVLCVIAQRRKRG